MVRPRYNVHQSKVYAAARLLWANVTAYLATFTAFNTLYTAGLVTLRKTTIDDAEALPDISARRATSELLRNELLAFLDTALAMQIALQSYIKMSFPSVDWDTQLDAAGRLYYNDAVGLNFSQADLMLANMQSFTAVNNAALLLGGQPTAFTADVATLHTDFSTKYTAYEAARIAILPATDLKVTANNQVYDEAIAAGDIARAMIPSFTPTELKGFTWTYLVNLLSFSGTSGVAGFFYDDATNLPIAGALVEIATLGISTYTDADGGYALNAGGGSYTLQVSMTGYITYTTPLTIDEGVIETLIVNLTV